MFRRLSEIMDDALFADGIDGVHGLRRRARTRLWFRALPPVNTVPDHLREAIENAPHLTVTAPELVQAVRVHAIPVTHGGQTDSIIREEPARIEHHLTSEERQERMLRRLGNQHQLSGIAPRPQTAALTDWRVVRRNAPTLMLAATSLLDGRKPGPILGPNCEYRVVSANDGVIGIEVRMADGVTEVGYGNSVDFMCIEPMVAHLGENGKRVSTKERLQRITRGFSNVTGALSPNS